MEGKNEDAAPCFTMVLDNHREMQDELGTIDTLHGLGRAMIRLGAPCRAATHLGKGLKLASVAGMGPRQTALLLDTAELFIATGRARRAAELLGLAQTQPAWASRKPSDIRRIVQAVEGQLEPDVLAEALRTGGELPLDGAVAETLADLVALESYREEREEPRPRRRCARRDARGPDASPASSSRPVRVLIVDEQEIIRAGLLRLLAGVETMYVVGEAASGEQALTLASELQPDLVLLDPLLSDLDGIEVVRRLLAAGNPARVLVLTSAGDNRRVRDAIQAGVTGYFLKDVSRSELLSAIEDVAAGRPALHPDVQRFLMQQTGAPEQPLPFATLTKRERDIMRFLALGFGNREIAGALGLTYGTVKVYVSALLDKLDVSDRTQAALIAARYGLDAPEEAALPRPSSVQ